MNNRTLIIALILWAVLSFLLNLLTNLVSNVLFPSLAGKPGLIVGAVIMALILSIPLSIYISVRTLPKEPDQPPLAVPSNETQPAAASLEPQPISQLPGKGYAMLIGRDGWIGDIMAALRDPGGKWMIGIDGMGGIGKTALAREVAELCQNERLFNSFVWIQAPKESFPLSNGDKGIGSLTFEAVLDNIARQLGALDVPKLKPAEKEARVKALLQSQRILVVLDNLETAKESQDEIARKLKPLLNPSKALLTSRRRFTTELHEINLGGLDAGWAVQFVKHTAKQRNISQIEGANQEELVEIYKATEGSPLAIKLVVGQLSILPLTAVLENLRKVKLSLEKIDQDEYFQFYKFIFAPSWRILSEDGKKLLISMAHFAPNLGGTYEAVKATSDLPDNVLNQCILELWRLSFLEKGESPSLHVVRYYLHALTQNYVLSDIVNLIK